MSETELKPCPCGGEAKLFINNTDLNSKYGPSYHSSCHVGCQVCGISQLGNYSRMGEHVTPEHISNTIKKWNTRPIEEALQEENARLREELKPFPMQNGPQITWKTARKVYAMYSTLYGTSQTIERIAQRGGFGWSEVETMYRDLKRVGRLEAALKE